LSREERRKKERDVDVFHIIIIIRRIEEELKNKKMRPVCCEIRDSSLFTGVFYL
jgi:hypothetical protein